MRKVLPRGTTPDSTSATDAHRAAPATPADDPSRDLLDADAPGPAPAGPAGCPESRIAEAFSLAFLLTAALQPARTLPRTLAA